MIQALQDFANYFTSLGVAVTLPFIIAISGIALGMKVANAIRSGVMVGVGFMGISLVLELMGGEVTPAAQAMTAQLGANLDIVDVGWPVAAAIAFATLYGALSIPLLLALNFVYILLGLTRTLNVDLWNFWISSTVAALVGHVSGNYVAGLVAAAAHMTLMLAFADITAPVVERYFKLPGITLAHGTTTPYGIIAIPLNWVFDRIPGLRTWSVTPTTLNRRFGPLGEPVIMGFVLGLVIGVLGYGWDDPAADLRSILTLAISLAAVMVLLPHMAGVLVSGLLDVSSAAQEFMKKRLPNRSFTIGVDSAVIVGDPAVISTALVMVPLTIGLSVLLEPLGNRTLPLVDLATIPFEVALMVGIFRGNIVRAVIGGGLIMSMGLFIATWVSGPFTELAAQLNGAAGTADGPVTSLVPGSNPALGIFVLGAHFGWGGIITTAVLAVAFLVLTAHTLSRRRGFEPGDVPETADVPRG